MIRYERDEVPWELPVGVDPASVKFDVTEYGPTTMSLADFLKAAPAPDQWVYEGYGRGGYVLRWAGTSDTLDRGGGRTVRFHVHGKGKKGWEFGGAWVPDTMVNFKINEVLRYEHNTDAIALVADHFEDEIEATRKQREEESD